MDADIVQDGCGLKLFLDGGREAFEVTDQGGEFMYFQEMLNATNPYGGLDFLMIDEVLEGTDPLGLNLLIESLKDVENPVYIISHVMNIKAGVPTLTITKENGISRIE